MDISNELLKEVVDTYYCQKCSIRQTAKQLNLSRNKVANVLKYAERLGLLVNRHGITCDTETNQKEFNYAKKVAELEKELKQIRKENLEAEDIRDFIYGLSKLQPKTPEWLITPKSNLSVIGVPSLACSDWHWAEVVDPKQVMHKNQYNIEIAKSRIKTLANRTIDLLKNHMVHSNYPGIVIPMLGDMLAGAIHEELKITNEVELLQAELSLLETCIWFIKTMADAFGNVFCPCVAGNHGRLSKKPRAKNYAYDNFDWHLYCLLEKWFENDPRVKFLISAGEDIQYKIYNTSYRATHGAQFRGGDGIIGPIGPIFRGDTKKRAQAHEINESYEILLLGHFHRVMFLRRTIVNGSLVGFDEFAFKNNFPYEPSQQALWITHPDRGVTFRLEVQSDNMEKSIEANSWVSWPAIMDI